MALLAARFLFGLAVNSELLECLVAHFCLEVVSTIDVVAGAELAAEAVAGATSKTTDDQK